MRKISFIYSFLGLVLFISTIGCTKYPDPPLVFEPTPELENIKDRKVLLINFDGLIGRELEKKVPTTIASLLENSKYTFHGVIEDDSGNAATWTSMLSSSDQSKHGIEGDKFNGEEDELDEDHTHGNTSGTATGFITIFQRLLESGKNLKTVSVTDNPDMDEYMFAYSDHRVVTNSDLSSKDSIVSILKRGVDFSLGVVSFRSLLSVGKTSGFSIDNPEYVSTLNTLDSYLADILTTIKSRNTYENEDWLIIVNSSHGGKGTSYGSSSFEDRNTLTIYHNPNFTENKLSRGVMNYMRYHGWYKGRTHTSGGITVVPEEEGVRAYGKGGDANKVFNIDHTGELSVEFKANFFTRILSHPGHSYYNSFRFDNQNMISKDLKASTDFTSTNSQADARPSPGWTITPMGTGQYRIGIADGVNNSVGITGSGRKNEAWQHVLVTFKRVENNKTEIVLFIDGSESTRGTFDVDPAKISNSEPVVIGFNERGAYGFLDVYMAEVRFWNKALSLAEVKQVGCEKEISDGHTLKPNLIASYSNVDHGVMKSTVGDANLDLTVSGNYKLLATNDFSLCSLGDQPYTVYDVSPQILYWLNIPIKEAWALKGSVFLNKYEVEFIK